MVSRKHLRLLIITWLAGAVLVVLAQLYKSNQTIGSVTIYCTSNKLTEADYRYVANLMFIGIGKIGLPLSKDTTTYFDENLVPIRPNNLEKIYPSKIQIRAYAKLVSDVKTMLLKQEVDSILAYENIYTHEISEILSSDTLFLDALFAATDKYDEKMSNQIGNAYNLSNKRFGGVLIKNTIKLLMENKQKHISIVLPVYWGGFLKRHFEKSNTIMVKLKSVNTL